MWMTARFLPVAPFSLKPAGATSSGGKTLLVMTPYALKMALLDVAVRTYGLAYAEILFPRLRDLSIALAPPDDILVFKTFSKIRRPFEFKESKKPKETETQEEVDARVREKLEEKQAQGQYPLQSTISFREYVFYRGSFELALTAPTGTALPEELPRLLLGINYVGKRGGFVQLVEPPHEIPFTGDQFIDLTSEQLEAGAFHVQSTLQMLDDCSADLTFAQANIYSPEPVTLGKERILRHVVLPYRQLRWSRNYSWYQRIAGSIGKEG